MRKFGLSLFVIFIASFYMGVADTWAYQASNEEAAIARNIFDSKPRLTGALQKRGGGQGVLLRARTRPARTLWFARPLAQTLRAWNPGKSFLFSRGAMRLGVLGAGSLALAAMGCDDDGKSNGVVYAISNATRYETLRIYFFEQYMGEVAPGETLRREYWSDWIPVSAIEKLSGQRVQLQTYYTASFSVSDPAETALTVDNQTGRMVDLKVASGDDGSFRFYGSIEAGKSATFPIRGGRAYPVMILDTGNQNHVYYFNQAFWFDAGAAPYAVTVP